MSDCEMDSLFPEEAVKPSGPEHHFATLQRPLGKGELTVRMVKRHVLWGDHLWNAGQWLASHFDKHPEEVAVKSVVELGAGAGLPSLVAALNGASTVVVTDYPDRELIDNLQWNLDENAKDVTNAKATGFLWGAQVDDLLALNNGQKFDILILCDLLFNHSEHSKLLRSCLDLLSPSGHIWCVYTHYLPDRMEKDLKFLELAQSAGLLVEDVGTHLFDQVMFKEDRGDPEIRRTCHIKRLRRKEYWGEAPAETIMSATTPIQPGQSSIQILLDAEREASAQVTAARQYRVQRLKDARAEAEAEIEAMKAGKKAELLAFEQGIVAGLEEAVHMRTRQTEAELKETIEMAEKQKRQVLDLLAEKVLQVQPALHPNALYKQQQKTD